jgi:hypothetical protein
VVTPGEAKTILSQSGTENNLEAAIGLGILSITSSLIAGQLNVVITLDAEISSTNLTALGILLRQAIVTETGIDASQMGPITFTEGSIIASFTIFSFGAASTVAPTGASASSSKVAEGGEDGATSDESATWIMPVVVSLVAAFCFLILGVLAYFFVKRRHTPAVEVVEWLEDTAGLSSKAAEQAGARLYKHGFTELKQIQGITQSELKEASLPLGSYALVKKALGFKETPKARKNESSGSEWFTSSGEEASQS